MLYEDIFNTIIEHVNNTDNIVVISILKNLRQCNMMLLKCVTNVSTLHCSVNLYDLFDSKYNCIFPNLKNVDGEIILTTNDSYTNHSQMSVFKQIKNIKCCLMKLVNECGMKNMRLHHEFLGEAKMLEDTFGGNYTKYCNYSDYNSYVGHIRTYIAPIIENMSYLTVSYRDWLNHGVYWWGNIGTVETKYSIFTLEDISSNNNKRYKLSTGIYPSFEKFFQLFISNEAHYSATLEGDVSRLSIEDNSRSNKSIDCYIITDNTTDEEITLAFSNSSRSSINTLIIESEIGITCFMKRLTWLNNSFIVDPDLMYSCDWIQSIVVPQNYTTLQEFKSSTMIIFPNAVITT